MNKNSDKKNKPSLTFRLARMFIVFFGIVVSTNSYIKYNEYKKLKEEELSLTKEIEKEEEKKLSLTFESEYYESDVYIEEVAREQLGLIKPDEMLIINREK